jgi:hypothetical protein
MNSFSYTLFFYFYNLLLPTLYHQTPQFCSVDKSPVKQKVMLWVAQEDLQFQLESLITVSLGFPTEDRWHIQTE